MKRQDGFTVLELVVAIVFLTVAGIVVFNQISQIKTISRDRERKTAINAMHYSLEEVFYKQNKYYPQTISSGMLPSVDPSLFTDPDGKKIGETGTSYFYDPLDCDGEKCKSYRLRADLENEADFIKDSVHR